MAPRPLAAQPDERRVVVARAGADRRALAERLAGALVSRLRARGIEARRPPEPAAPPDSLADELEAAERAYANLRPKRARAKLEALVSQLDRTGGAGLDHRGLVRVQLLLALAAAAEGDAGARDEALARALAMDPDLAPDPARYPPALRDRIARIREERDAGLRIRLSFEGLPQGARGVVDGRPLPDGAQAIRVAPGTHWVRIEGEGWRPEGGRVELGESKRRLRWRLEPDPGGLLRSAGRPGDPPGEDVRRAAAALNAFPVLVDATARGARTRLVVRDPASSRTIRLTAPADADAGQLAREIARRLASAGPLGPTPRERRLRRWTAAGAAVVAAGILTGIVVALVGDERSEQWRGEGRVAR